MLPGALKLQKFQVAAQPLAAEVVSLIENETFGSSWIGP
jgi:hypothetical protein